jgi:ABC-2 type transport system ATP-binding protein
MIEESAIEVHGLSKVFGEKVAVKDLNLKVKRGEVFGFLGPNGAGKTTSIKMLLGLIEPTEGEGRILGGPLGDYRVRSRVGFLPEHFRFHEWLTATEFLHVHADLYARSRIRATERVEELLDKVGLSAHADKRLRQFSKGMLQRIGLAQALLNHPDLVILDEPTSGLDPVGRLLVRDVIRDLREQGATVFLNSHLLSEVEVTCDRVAFIKQGEVIRVTTLAELVEQDICLEIHVRQFSDEVTAGLDQWGEDLKIEDNRLTMQVINKNDLPEINRFLIDQGMEVYAFYPHERTLEELFIQIVGLDGEV